MEFNINDIVKVKLTDVGLRIHKERWKVLNKRNPSVFHSYSPPVVDENGYTRYQMWELMERYGSAVGLAKHLPFETEIVIGE